MNNHGNVLFFCLQLAEMMFLCICFEQYDEFLEQLSETMKVDSIAVDLGFDMRLKLILSRVEQLVKQEATALVESKSLTYSLQRKVGNINKKS